VNPTAAAVTEKMKAASKDSLQAFLKFATDPVAGLSVAYGALDESWLAVSSRKSGSFSIKPAVSNRVVSM
jgi:hypothetical protein